METVKMHKASRGAISVALSAAFFTALNALIDNYIVHNVIISTDRITAASFYLIVGAWVYILCAVVCNKIFGKQIDADYPGFTLGTKKMHVFTVISGTAGAISTFLYLLGSQKLDPSLVLILSCFAVIYVAVFDILKKNIKSRIIIIPACLIILGSGLASMPNIFSNIEVVEVTVWGIIIFAGFCSVLNAFGDIVRKKGVGSADAVTFSFWRFIWLSVIATILLIATALIRGKFYDLLEMQKALTLPAFGWISLTMVLANLYNVLSQKALKLGAVSVVLLSINSKIAMGVLLTVLINFLSPGAFGDIPKEWFVWVARSVGAILTVVGVFNLKQKTEKGDS